MRDLYEVDSPAELIHESHRIDHDSNTIVRGRFGETWECVECCGEAYATVAGRHLDNRLRHPCASGDPLGYWKHRLETHERGAEQAREEIRRLEKDEKWTNG